LTFLPLRRPLAGFVLNLTGQTGQINTDNEAVATRAGEMERQTAWATDGAGTDGTMYTVSNLASFSGSDTLDEKQTYTKTEAYKLYSRVY